MLHVEQALSKCESLIERWNTNWTEKTILHGIGIQFDFKHMEKIIFIWTQCYAGSTRGNIINSITIA